MVAKSGKQLPHNSPFLKKICIFQTVWGLFFFGLWGYLIPLKNSKFMSLTELVSCSWFSVKDRWNLWLIVPRCSCGYVRCLSECKSKVHAQFSASSFTAWSVSRDAWMNSNQCGAQHFTLNTFIKPNLDKVRARIPSNTSQWGDHLTCLLLVSLFLHNCVSYGEMLNQSMSLLYVCFM